MGKQTDPTAMAELEAALTAAVSKALRDGAPDIVAAVGRELLSLSDPSETLRSRPTRHGMWFLASRAHMHKYEVEEQCDIYEEFFAHHPNGLDSCRNFVAVRLSEPQVEKYHSDIRMSSYRWRDVRGVGSTGSNFSIPGNYGWFLDLLDDHGWLGWMDFVAVRSPALPCSVIDSTHDIPSPPLVQNIGVNVPVADTLAYMGHLYARCITIGEWLFDKEALHHGLARGWIYQENAFGPLDPTGVDNLFGCIRAVGKRLRAGDDGAIDQFMEWCGRDALGGLLLRRGYNVALNTFTSDPPLRSSGDYGGAQAIIRMADRLVRRMEGDDDFNTTEAWESLEARARKKDGSRLARVMQRVTATGIASLHAMDYFTSSPDEFSMGIVLMRRLLCEPTYSEHKSLDEFVQASCMGLLRSYTGLSLTNEQDRYEATTAVARHIASNFAGKPIDSLGMLRLSWTGRLRSLIKTVAKAKKGLYVHFPLVEDLIEGQRIPAIGYLSGTQLVCRNGTYAYLSKAGIYHAIDHAQFRDMTGPPIEENGDTFKYLDRDVRCFVCNLPPWLVDVCADAKFLVLAPEHPDLPSQPSSKPVVFGLFVPESGTQLPPVEEENTFY